MRIFEQKLCEITTALSQHKVDKLVRPKLIMRESAFTVCSITDLRNTDLIVCNLGLKDVREGLSSSTWGAIERFIRLNFEWQKTVSPEPVKEKK